MKPIYYFVLQARLITHYLHWKLANNSEVCLLNFHFSPERHLEWNVEILLDFGLFFLFRVLTAFSWAPSATPASVGDESVSIHTKMKKTGKKVHKKLRSSIDSLRFWDAEAYFSTRKIEQENFTFLKKKMWRNFHKTFHFDESDDFFVYIFNFNLHWT